MSAIKDEESYEIGYRDGESSCSADIVFLREDYEDKLDAQAKRIAELEAAVRDARGYAALALDRPTLQNRNTLKSIIEALDRAALKQAG